MKNPTRFRYLATNEELLARSVFENSLPYKRIVISDGLGYDNRPFTVPEADTSTPRYILHVGEGYYGMSTGAKAKALLIHELVHVWQGEHATWSWSYVFRSGWHQATSDDAYSYDPANLGRWTSYNPEQQASLVEDWYKVLRDQGRAAAERDVRFPFIRFWIRGKRTIEAPDNFPREPSSALTVEAYEEGLQIPADVLFGFDSALLRPTARGHLGRAVDILNQQANGRTVLILGHTDSIGSPAYNRTLSLRRAGTVKRWLERNGAKIKMVADGKGESSPAAPNTTAEGRARNRRVEFWYQ